MKKHLYLLIATLAITLLSADAMAQKNIVRPPFFMDFMGLKLFEKAKGDIDSMVIYIYDDLHKKNFLSSTRITEYKSKHIFEIVRLDKNNKIVYKSKFTSTTGSYYDKCENYGVKKDGKEYYSTSQEVNISPKNSLIISHYEGSEADTLHINYMGNYAQYYVGQYRQIPIYQTVGFNKDGYKISIHTSRKPLKPEQLKNSLAVTSHAYTDYDEQNILRKIRTGDREEHSEEEITVVNSLDKRGNWVVQILQYPNKKVVLFQRKIYYKK